MDSLILDFRGYILDLMNNVSEQSRKEYFTIYVRLYVSFYYATLGLDDFGSTRI